MKDWPPIKAWTSNYPINGHRHFVAINYYQVKNNYWVVFVSVVDSKTCFHIKFNCLKDSSDWFPGWINSGFDQELEDLKNNSFIKDCSVLGKDCLYPSEDSGLYLPCNETKCRLWF